MASHPKTGVQSFNTDWQKAVAWAQSQGIGPSSYLPVYQMDLNRIQNGRYPMGIAERNLEIQAAHNPKAVSSAPSDQPQSPYTPTGLMGNVVSDAGKIFTGFGSIFTGGFEKQLWQSAKDTFDGVLNPARFEGPQLGTTIGNWLTKSLLSYFPGMYDIGTVLEHDPTLTGSSGFTALMGHPLVSLLDMAGADALGAGALGKLASGEGIMGKLGAGSAMAKSYRGWARSDGSLFHQLANVKASSKLGAATLGRAGVGKPNTTVAGQGAEAMSISDVMQKWATNVPGVGRAVGDAMQAYSDTGRMGHDHAIWLAEPANRAWQQLDQQGKDLVTKILDTRGHTEGDSVVQAYDDPNVDPLVKDALHAILEGPLRHSTENSIFSGALRPTISLDGRTGLWVAKSAPFRKINAARIARDMAHRQATEQVTRLQPFVEKLGALDELFPRAVEKTKATLVDARRAVAERPLGGRITREKAKGTKFRAAEGLDKNKQVVSVLGEGGLADEFLAEVAKNKDPDQVITLVKQMRGRLSQWNVKSINAIESRADHPELAAFYDVLAAFEEWAHQSKETSAEIDHAIHGEIETQSHLDAQHLAHRAVQMQKLIDSQRTQRAELTRIHNARIAEVTDRFNRDSKAINDSLAGAINRLTTAGDAETARLTKAATDVVYARISKEIRALEAKAKADRIALRQKKDLQLGIAKRDKKIDLLELSKKNHTARVALGKKINTEKVGIGDLMETLTHAGKAIDLYHQALYDNVSDEYRDVEQMLYEKHLRIHENSQTLIAQTERFMKNKLGYEQARIDKIRGNKDVMAEYMTAVFRGMFGQPDWTPEVAKMAQQAMREARDSAHEELKYAIAHKDLRIQYIPSAHAFDERLLRPSAFNPIIGKGVPKPDMEKMKLWDMTAKKDDFALGINAALVQTLQRQAVIDLTETYLSPLGMRASDLSKFIATHFNVEDRLKGGNVLHEVEVLASKELGMTRFDPHALFGFSLPRWGPNDEALYLPTGIVHALQKMEKDRGAAMRLAGKSTKLFRYSILYLSPRYTAHILFGGTVMLAMRSSPYALSFIGEAYRGIRDGILPGAASHAAEEGFEDIAMRLHNEAGGRSMGVSVMAEDIEKNQKVPLAKANPINWLRAAANANVRFTRYVRDMQYAVAMLDGAAKAERRAKKIPIEDDHGNTIMMTPERAMKEGMHHAEQVYGNLNRMSPFERQVAQSIMPFYGWQRHILGYVFSFPFDHPWRALILSQTAFLASQQVPLGFPLRIQFLYNLGSPDAQGNVQPIDLRSLDPFRDVANYASWTGFFESLNPALSAPLTMAFGSGAAFGNATLYPNVTYNQFYGIETAGSQGGLLQGIKQWVPQTGAAASAISAATQLHSLWTSNRPAAIKQILNDMNIPFYTPPINVQQVAAKTEGARFEVAKTAAANAFQSGDFSALKGYKTVPNPLNTAYEITPAQLEALYNQALQATPGVAPIESLLPPPTPPGY